MLNKNLIVTHQKVTTTGSKSAKGFKGELNNLAKPISAILTRPRSTPSPITRILAGFFKRI